MFIGRKEELHFLNEHYNSDKAEFIVLYGRRRIGKTETLTEFCRDKPNIFYACKECTDKKQFASFNDAILDFDYSLKKQVKRFSDWEDAFSTLGNLDKTQKVVVVIDEFPYMCKYNKGIPSILQNLWDHKLSKSNIMLIICGSSMSFMEDDILGSKNPLYGRMTGIYKMEPMRFDDAVQFFPNYSDEDKLLAYSILGGIPHYLRQFSPNVSLAQNVKTQILTKGTILFNEVEYILHQELRETAFYNTLIETIATGSNRFNEICDKSQIESNKVSVYLKNLIELGIITKEYPILASTKDKTKKNQGEYKVEDNFFRFWFAYAYKYMSELAKGEIDDIWDIVIEPDLHHFASKSFENISISHLRKLRKQKKVPFTFLQIGRWWGTVTKPDENGKSFSQSEEIDILATDKDEQKFIIGECKFTNEPFDLGQLKALKNKLNLKYPTYYYLFSLNGFTDAVVEEANNADNISLYTLSDMLCNQATDN